MLIAVTTHKVIIVSRKDIIFLDYDQNHSRL